MNQVMEVFFTPANLAWAMSLAVLMFFYRTYREYQVSKLEPPRDIGDLLMELLATAFGAVITSVLLVGIVAGGVRMLQGI